MTFPLYILFIRFPQVIIVLSEIFDIWDRVGPVAQTYPRETIALICLPKGWMRTNNSVPSNHRIYYMCHCNRRPLTNKSIS